MPVVFNVGDTVRCVHASPYALTLNRLYLVQSVEPDGMFLTVINDLGINARYAAHRFTADLQDPTDSDAADEPLEEEIDYSSDDDEDDDDPENYLRYAYQNYVATGEYLDNGDDSTETLRERVAPGDILLYLFSGERVRVIDTTIHFGEYRVVPIENDDDADYFTMYPYCDEHAIVRQRTEIYGQPPQTTVKVGKNIKVLTLKDIK